MTKKRPRVLEYPFIFNFLFFHNVATLCLNPKERHENVMFPFARAHAQLFVFL